MSQSALDQTKINKDKVIQILNQFSAIAQQKRLVVFHHHPYQFADLYDAFTECGYGTIQPLYWYKKGHNYQGDKNHFVQAVEPIMVGFFPKQSAFQLDLPLNPTERHNLLVFAPPSTKQRNSDSERINPFEKPVSLSQHILTTLLPGNSHVLVGCMGSGSEVLGALAADMQVIGFDLDPAQVQATKERLHKVAKRMKDLEEKQAQAQQKSAAKASEEEEKEGSSPAKVQTILDKTGSIGGDPASSVHATCRGCKARFDVRSDDAAYCKFCNKWFHKPASEAVASSSSSVAKQDCSISCLQVEGSNMCNKGLPNPAQGYFCDAECHERWHAMKERAAKSASEQDKSA